MGAFTIVIRLFKLLQVDRGLLTSHDDVSDDNADGCQVAQIDQDHDHFDQVPVPEATLSSVVHGKQHQQNFSLLNLLMAQRRATSLMALDMTTGFAMMALGSV